MVHNITNGSGSTAAPVTESGLASQSESTWLLYNAQPPSLSDLHVHKLRGTAATQMKQTLPRLRREGRK